MSKAIITPFFIINEDQGLGQNIDISIDELKKSGYRDIFVKLKEAVNSYSGDGEYVWTIDNEDDPFGLSEMIEN